MSAKPNARPAEAHGVPRSDDGDAAGTVHAPQLTDYQAKYFAYELSKRCTPDSIEKLASALVDAQVDLNPHQVDAALFAFRSPLSTGAILADEVGLGKTIEAGLVISQRWAERKRRILVITPSNLRKQWYPELTGNFFIPYQPDFVAETGDSICMLEPKARNELQTPEVQAKKAAVKWCEQASEYAVSTKGTLWHHVLIAHDAIAENMTLKGLADQFVVKT